MTVGNTMKSCFNRDFNRIRTEFDAPSKNHRGLPIKLLHSEFEIQFLRYFPAIFAV